MIARDDVVTASMGRSPDTGPAHLLVDEATAAQALRERIYAALTGIATVATLLGYAEETSASSATASLGVTMGGLWAASVVADIVSHPASHGGVLSRSHWHRIAVVAGQAVEIAIVPLAAISLAGTGIWSVRTGLVIAAVALVLALAAATFWAVRRTTFSIGKRMAIVSVELALASLVILVKVVAH